MEEKQLELAEELTRSIIEAGVNNARKRNAPPANFDGVCECGTDVPLLRMEAGYYNCVHCQEVVEYKSTGKQMRRL